MMPDLPAAWADALAPVACGADYRRLIDFLIAEQGAGKIIYPPAAVRFRALDMVSPDAAKVVILGQDPYHGPGQAHGAAFSVPPGVKPPPSLANIFKELAADLGFAPPAHGLLDHWARQGVLLLNTVLSVEAERAGSHQGRGWECLTDAVIRTVSDCSPPAVFMLWGSHAQKKAPLIGGRHLVLTAAHPSPLSAYRGFFGCRHFSRANAFLAENGSAPIDWALPPIDQ